VIDSFLHVTVPYSLLDRYLPLVKEEGLNLEIYFGSSRFDEIQESDIIHLKEKLDYDPKLTFHAPYMDLAPAAIDTRIRQVTMERFNTVLDFAGILKPRIIVFHSGYDQRKFDSEYELWLSGSLSTWRPIAIRAEEMGIQIAIENIFEDEPHNLTRLVEEMNRDNFGLCFDTGHFNLFSKLPLSEWLDITRPHIRELHLHDNEGYSDDHLSIGEGNVDFQTIFRETRDLGCVYTIESHTPDAVLKSIKTLRSFIE
jgi:sugar phosphate isomerase/epimerase